MKLIVVDSRHNIGSWLIKIFTFSRWNHTATLYDDGTVFDSTFLSGVRALSYEKFTEIYPRRRQVLIDIDLPNERAAREFAEAQVGKSYDWSAILGVIFQNRKWNSPEDWFCSEYSEAQISKGGFTFFRDTAHNILPRESYAIARGTLVSS